MRIDRYTIVLSFLLAAFAFSGQARPQVVTSSNQPVVQVAAETTAQQDRLVLGDVAEVRASDAEIAARLRAVSLGYAPNVGSVRELPRERIALAITAAGFAEGTFQLSSPAVALVRRAAQTIDPALVREEIERVALTDLNASGATARLSHLDLPPLIEAPSGKIEIRATVSNARDVFLPFTVFVELWQEGRVVKRFNATAQVEAFASVFVAAREIAANTRLRPEHFKPEIKRLERPLNNYVTEAERLRGMAVRHDFARGDAITTEAISSEIIVRPGDQVRIIGQSGPLQIVVNGEARAAGRIGDRIQVKNLQSGTLLQAIVTDEGIVRVRF
ncbi:MAG: flagellar basal body P-ring formation protein FlgA [Acidobacteria bacterium]|nr:flagellar basal body P-ring formation protein FlgA [Acidobacteriota bacterium]